MDIDWDEINGILEKVAPGMNSLSYEERRKGCISLYKLSSKEKAKIEFLTQEVGKIAWPYCNYGSDYSNTPMTLYVNT